MKIIVQGHTIETLDIWDIKLKTSSREVKVIIKITDKPNIEIRRDIKYETYSYEFSDIFATYEKLYNEIKAKWESDKSDIPVFKL